MGSRFAGDATVGVRRGTSTPRLIQRVHPRVDAARPVHPGSDTGPVGGGLPSATEVTYAGLTRVAGPLRHPRYRGRGGRRPDLRPSAYRGGAGTPARSAGRRRRRVARGAVRPVHPGSDTGLAGAALNLVQPAGPGFVIGYMALAALAWRLPRRTAFAAGAVVLVAVGYAVAVRSAHPLTAAVGVALGAGFMLAAGSFAAISREARETAEALLAQEAATRAA